MESYIVEPDPDALIDQLLTQLSAEHTSDSSRAVSAPSRQTPEAVASSEQARAAASARHD